MAWAEFRLYDVWPEAKRLGKMDDLKLKYEIPDRLTLMNHSPWVLLKGVPYKASSKIHFNSWDWVLPEDIYKKLKKEGLVKKNRKPLNGALIVIDPGHGGKDPGAIGMGGLQEKSVVLDISRRVVRQLRAKGMNVKMTRNSDVFVDLHHRCVLSNRWRATVFVSIHCNSNHSRSLRGFQIYRQSAKTSVYQRAKWAAKRFPLSKYTPISKFGKDQKFSNHTELYRWKDKESFKLAQDMKNVLAYRKSKLRTMPQKNLCVLRETMAPSVLVETDFISNPEIETYMEFDDWREKMAEDISEGILVYLGLGRQS